MLEHELLILVLTKDNFSISMLSSTFKTCFFLLVIVFFNSLILGLFDKIVFPLLSLVKRYGG